MSTGGTRAGGRNPGRRESGQALIELAILLPVVGALLGIVFNGWDAMQQSIRLTSAARAGAIAAANDWANSSSANAQTDALAAVNDEENTSAYQDRNGAGDNYVDIPSALTSETTSGGVTIKTITVTITHASVTLVPIVWNIHVTTRATARVS